MLVKGFDNKEYKLKLSTKISKKCSNGHLRARILLKEIFPNDIVYEEVSLLGSAKFNSKTLRADFLIPSHKLLIEVHGKQHYQKTFFHQDKLSYLKSKRNDIRKIAWCGLNNILYIALSDEETNEQWKYRIFNRYED